MPTAQIHPHPRSALPSKGRAFTTIEILIVVVIMAIMAAVAVPMIGNRSDIKIAAAVRKAVADLQYAQNLSIATRQNVYLRFDTNTYTVCKKVGSVLTAISDPIDRMTYTVTLGTNPTSAALAGVGLAKPSFAGNSVIGFDSVGAPFSFNETSGVRTSMTVSAQLQFTCGTTTQTILIEPYTGEISVP